MHVCVYIIIYIALYQYREKGLKYRCRNGFSIFKQSLMASEAIG